MFKADTNRLVVMQDLRQRVLGNPRRAGHVERIHACYGWRAKLLDPMLPVLLCVLAAASAAEPRAFLPRHDCDVCEARPLTVAVAF